MKILLTYLFTAFALLVYGQKEKVELSISPDAFEIGEVFTITVTSTVQGNLEIENLPSSYVQDYSISQGSTQEVDYNSGVVTTLYYTSYSGIITKSGDYTIGPAWVKAGNKSYSSDKVDVKVSRKVSMNSGSVTAQQLNDPAFGVIECNKREIFEGEPLLLSAKIYSYYDPSHISSYQSYHLNGTIIKNPIGNSSNIKVVDERFKGKKLKAFDYDKNVIFPDVVGNFQIDPFKLNLHQGYKSFPITSSGLVIKVKPLPANPPNDFIGGAGSFNVERLIEDTAIAQGEVFKLILTIEGTGNLQNLEVPDLILPKGFVVYGDPTVNENFVITANGADGSVDYEYNIQATNFGKQSIPGTSVSYFDPDKEKYIRVLSDEVEISIEKDKKFQEQLEKQNLNSETEMIVHNADIRQKAEHVERGSLFGSAVYWTGVGIPVTAALFFLFFTRIKKRSEEDIRVKSIQKGRREELELCLKDLNDASTSDISGFFTKVEDALQLAMVYYHPDQEDRRYSKSEILDKLNSSGSNADRIGEILNTSENLRYGFGGGESLDIDSMRRDVIESIRSMNK